MRSKLLTALACAFSAALLIWLLWPSTCPSQPEDPDPATPAAESAAATTAADIALPARREAAETPPPTQRVHGMVHTRSEKPVAGAALRLLSLDPSRDAPLAVTHSDDAGRFDLPLPPDCTPPFRLEASAPGHTSWSTDSASPARECWILLRPLGVLYGRVLAKDTHRPLLGATLDYEGTRAISGTDGSYELSCPADGEVFYVASNCAGYLEDMACLRIHEPGRAPFDVLLEPGMPVTLQVVDRRSYAPIAGAKVRRHRTDPVLASSDGEGRLTQSTATGREMRIWVSAPGYCSLTWKGAVDTPRLEPLLLTMQPSATLAGRAADEQGRGLAGVGVDLRDYSCPRLMYPVAPPDDGSPAMPGSAADVPPDTSTRSGADGCFALRVVPTTSSLCAVGRFADCVDARSEPVMLPDPGARAFVELVLRRGATVYGSVTRNGKAAGGLVRARPPGGARGHGSALVGRDGSYELTGLPAGDVELRIESKFKDPAADQVTLHLSPGERLRHDFVRNVAVGRLGGRVTSSRGEALADVQVHAIAGDPRLFFTTQSRADGTFDFDVAPAQVYQVTATRGNTQDRREDVPSDAEDLAFVLPVLGHLRLRLVDATTREPVSSKETGLHDLAWRPAGEVAFRELSDQSDITGALDLELPLGPVDIAVSRLKDGFAPQHRYGLLVGESPDPAPIEIALARGLEVRIAFAGERPFDAATRRDHLLFLLETSQLGSLRGPFPQQGGPSNIRFGGINLWLGEPGLLHQLLMVQEDGTAMVKGLAPGEYTLRAYPDDFVFTPATATVGESRGFVRVQWRRQ